MMDIDLADKIRWVEARGGYAWAGTSALNGTPEWRCEIGDDHNIIDGVCHQVDEWSMESMEEAVDRAIVAWAVQGYRWVPR